VAQVGAVFALLLRRADAQEVHVGEIGRQVVVRGEPQSPGSQVVGQQLSQTRLIEGDVTRGQLGDFPWVDIDTDDLVPQLRHPDCVRGAQIPSAKDGASHTSGVGGRHELIASRR
jgi:hypothetical protein